MYKARCVNGHVFDVHVGSELERQCIDAVSKGFGDLPMVKKSLCEHCCGKYLKYLLQTGESTQYCVDHYPNGPSEHCEICFPEPDGGPVRMEP